jgi:hypothetical protein
MTLRLAICSLPELQQSAESQHYGRQFTHSPVITAETFSWSRQWGVPGARATSSVPDVQFRCSCAERSKLASDLPQAVTALTHARKVWGSSPDQSKVSRIILCTNDSLSRNFPGWTEENHDKSQL